MIKMYTIRYSKYFSKQLPSKTAIAIDKLIYAQ